MIELDLPIGQQLILIAILALGLVVYLVWEFSPRRTPQNNPELTETDKTIEFTADDLNPLYGAYIQLGMRGKNDR